MKFSTANSQNRHLAYAEARFLPRNLFHFYKKSSSPPRHTLFSEIPCIAASFPLLPIVSPPRHTLFCRFPCVAASFPLLIIEFHPRHTLFRRFPCVALSLPPVPTFPLAPNPLSLSDFLNPRAPHLRRALPVIA